MRTPSLRAVPAVLVLATLAACGGGGGDEDTGGTGGTGGVTTVKGRFVDAPVIGLGYSCSSGGAIVSSGTTTANGEFDYVTGSTCSFKIGGVTLGSALAAAVLTPVQLVPGAIDETNPTVNNIVRLLMSLDSDSNATNGITIDAAAATALGGKTLDFTLSPTAFTTAATTVLNAAYPTRTLATATQASTQFSGQLLALLAGTFSCTFSGTVSGTATLSIANGAITGSGTPTAPAGPAFALSGAVGSNGNAQIGGATSTGASFSGAFTIDGRGSGNWTDGTASGTWLCNRS